MRARGTRLLEAQAPDDPMFVEEPRRRSGLGARAGGFCELIRPQRDRVHKQWTVFCTDIHTRSL